MELLTRRQVADLLTAVANGDDNVAKRVLQHAIAKVGVDRASISLSPLSDILQKVKGQDKGFSLNDIVALGTLTEYADFQASTVQNWIKRDAKDFIGSPRHGKRYSADQAALIFLVNDLKCILLHFKDVRRVLEAVFQSPDTDADDLVRPLQLFTAYATIFDQLDVDGDEVLSSQGDISLPDLIEEKADQFAATLSGLTAEHKSAIANAILIATLAIQTAYFQHIAKAHLQRAIVFAGLDV